MTQRILGRGVWPDVAACRGFSFPATMKPILSFSLLLAAALLAPLAAVRAAAPELSTITSRADLDAVVAATPDAALKKALTEHAAAILAAAEQHPHVEAVIRTIESAPGTFTKLNTTPEALKNTAGGDIALFDTLTMVNTNILGGRAHQHRDAKEDPYDAAFIGHLGHIPALESVSLVVIKLEDSWLDPLLGLSNLKTLLIDKSAAPPLGDTTLEKLQPLSKLSNLKSLSLHGFGKEATDAGLEHLAGLKSLEYFSLNSRIPGHAFAKFEGWTNLKSIRFHGNAIDDEGLSYICERFPNLESLNLIHAPVLTDASGPHLQKLTKLKNIAITEGPKLTAAWLKNASRLPLESLLIEGGPATPPAEAIGALKSIPTLRRLSMGGSLFTDADLAMLASLTQLEQLTLGSLELPDARLPQLQAFSFLKSITFALRPKGYPEEIQAKVKALLPKVDVKFVK